MEPLPAAVADVVAWATAAPAAALARPTLFPYDVQMRTSFYFAADAAAARALPFAPAAPVTTRAGGLFGGRRLRSEAAAEEAGAAPLRAALAARLLAEGPACVAALRLEHAAAAAPARRRALLQDAAAPAPARDAAGADDAPEASPLAPLLSVDPAELALALLRRVASSPDAAARNGTGAAASAAAPAAAWGALLALRLQAAAGVYAAQLLEARFGLNYDLNSRPAAVSSAFARWGLLLDEGADLRLRLGAPAAAARREAAAPAPDAPPEAPPAAQPKGALTLALPTTLPAAAAADAVAFLALLRGAAGGAGDALLAPLQAALSSGIAAGGVAASLPPLTRRVSIVVAPNLAFGLGQLAFTVPSDARALAAAVAAPELVPLLAPDISFEASFNLWIDLVFQEAAPQRAKRWPLGRRSLRQQQPTTAFGGGGSVVSAAAPASASPPGALPPPAALLAAARAALTALAAASGDPGAAPQLARLFVSLSAVQFDAAACYVSTGVALIEALRLETQPSLAALGAAA